MGPRGAKSKVEIALSGNSIGPATGKPDAILVVGLCGGLTESLPEGRIVSYTECRSTEATKPMLHCSEGITNSVGALLASSGILCERAVGITSPRIATTRDERLALARFGATVVDMESYSILEAAAIAGVPCAVLRVIADSIDRVLPNLNHALNDAGALDGRKA